MAAALDSILIAKRAGTRAGQDAIADWSTW